MSDMWVTIEVDVMQAEKMWKALVASHVALGKAEAKVMSQASMEIVARAFPMLVPTMVPTSLPLPPPLCQSDGGGRGPLTMLVQSKTFLLAQVQKSLLA